VFGNDAKDTGIAVEVWRYYLLAVRPESSDAAFQWDDFAAKNNSELNDNLGNFLNRSLKFIFARFEGTVPGMDEGGAGAEEVAALGAVVAPLVEKYIDALEKLKLRDGLRTAMLVSKAGNAFFQDNAIWRVFKENPAAARSLITACAGLAALLAALMQPYMPSFSAKLLAQLGMAQAPLLTDDLVTKAADIGRLVPAGHKIGAEEPTPLFRKITDAEIEDFRQRFAGNQADRAAAAAAAPATAAAAPAAKPGAAVEKKPAAGGKSAAAGAATADGPAGKAAGGKKAASAAADTRPADVSRIDLRVGVINKAWRHPEADRCVGVAHAQGARVRGSRLTADADCPGSFSALVYAPALIFRPHSSVL